MNPQETYSKWLSIAGKNSNEPDQKLFEMGVKLIFEELSELISIVENNIVSEDLEKLTKTISIKSIESLNEDQKKEVVDALMDLGWVLGNTIHGFYGDLTDSQNWKTYNSHWFAVANSNWSKFCRSEEEAKTTVRLYKSGEHPDKQGKEIQASYKHVPYDDQDYWIVYLNDGSQKQGKILKSHLYKEPKIKI